MRRHDPRYQAKGQEDQRQEVVLPPELLELWARLFVNRAQPYALQKEDGTYRYRHAPCDGAVLAAHLCGAQTIALSSTDARGWCKWVCLDSDAPDALPWLLDLGRALAAQGLPGVVETSRRGGHLWLFLDRAVPALQARCVVDQALQIAVQGDLQEHAPRLERYPDTTAAGALGHAMRLPLGIHRVSSARYALLNASGEPRLGTVEELAWWLAHEAPRIPVGLVQTRWERFLSGASPPHLQGAVLSSSSRMTTMTTMTTMESGQGTRSAVIRWVDAQISALTLLDEFAPECEPRRAGQGYLGWCPFHDDRAPDRDGRPGSPSFYVIHNMRYGWSWRCLSSNCLQSAGPMRHSFRLFQDLVQLDVATAIRAALHRWPAARGENTYA
jgi:hypothetical protein